MKFKAIYFSIAVLILASIAGCSKSGKGENFSGPELKSLIISSMEGSKDNNELIGKLFDYSIPLPKNYNSLIIDSIIVPPKVRYYYAVIEFPNPIYNRFAVYDSVGALRLMDKSLNGYLKAMKYGDQNYSFLTITERFTSKDVIKLERVNFYYFNKDTVTAALRTFTSYNDSLNDFRQSFLGFTNGRLSASLSGTSKKPFNPSEFYYALDTVKRRFLSQSTVFDDSIYSFIYAKKGKFSDMQIIDKKSAIQSTGQQASVDTVSKYNNFKEKKAGFSLSLPPAGWKIQKNVYVSAQLKRPTQGTIFYNDVLGAKFSVIEIKYTEVAENFVNYSLTQEERKYYTVRSTDKISIARLYFRFFEVSNVDKRFLVIFECPKASYEKNQQEYTNIFNTFSID